MLHLIKGGSIKLSSKKADVGLPHVRRMQYRGLPINVELDIGMTASGKDADGIPWKVKYDTPYGEIANTEGRDGDPVDVYIGADDSDLVYVIHQVKKNGSFDEDKCMLGFKSPIEATACYFRHGPRWGFGSIETILFSNFVSGYLVGARDNGKTPVRHIIYPKDDF